MLTPLLQKICDYPEEAEEELKQFTRDCEVRGLSMRRASIEEDIDYETKKKFWRVFGLAYPRYF